MKRCLLFALNSKSTQFNLAIRYLAAAISHLPLQVEILELSTQYSHTTILAELFRCRADLIGFSCYIWNIEQIVALLADFRKLCPSVKVVLGGPEVSFVPEYYLRQNLCDFVISGAGEKPFFELLTNIDNAKSWSGISGLSYLDKDLPQGNLLQNNLPTRDQNFELTCRPYSLLPELFQNSFIYFEGSRGCAFNCHFCLSALDKPLYHFPLEQIFADLDTVLSDEQIHQIRFVDRTFNFSARRANQIWEFLFHRYPQRYFHFEIGAELLNADNLALLQKLSGENFRFEIGVQSFDEEVLKKNGRYVNMRQLEENIDFLLEKTAVTVHLDLLVGLEGQNMASFIDSFNRVFAKKPHYLQIETIKFLKGSIMRQKAERMGAVVSSIAPYNLLFSNDWPYEEIRKTEDVARLLDLYFNRQALRETVWYHAQEWASPWQYWSDFADFFRHRHGRERSSISLKNCYITMSEWIMNSSRVVEEHQMRLTLDYLREFQSAGHTPWEKLSQTLAMPDFVFNSKKFGLGKRGFIEKLSKPLRFQNVEAELFYFGGRGNPLCRALID